jgi:CheY-like chemotaxis protein
MHLPRKPLIVAVDDNEDDRFIIQQAFAQFAPEYALRTLESGLDLIQLLPGMTPLPALVLLDINMPRLDGLETLQYLREQPAWQGLLVVMLTTSNHPEDVSRAYRLGATGFWTKPALFSDYAPLLQTISQRWLM